MRLLLKRVFSFDFIAIVLDLEAYIGWFLSARK